MTKLIVCDNVLIKSVFLFWPHSKWLHSHVCEGASSNFLLSCGLLWHSSWSCSQTFTISSCMLMLIASSALHPLSRGGFVVTFFVILFSKVSNNRQLRILEPRDIHFLWAEIKCRNSWLTHPVTNWLTQGSSKLSNYNHQLLMPCTLFLEDGCCVGLKCASSPNLPTINSFWCA